MKLGNQNIKITKEGYGQIFIYLLDQPTDNDCWRVIVMKEDGTDIRLSWDRQDRLTGKWLEWDNLTESAQIAITQAIQDLDTVTV